MGRQALEKHDFTFVGGLNTEAGYLTFPDNAWLAGDNVSPEIDGSINRRTKIDFEAGQAFSDTFSTDTKESMAFFSKMWSNAGGNGSTSFVVVQQGAIVRFYNTESSSVSPGEKSFTIDLTDYKVPTSANVFGTSVIDIAVGNGKLIIVSEDTEPILVEYDATADSITVTQITLKIRDLSGVVDSTTTDVRLNTLSATHHYNLINQGWDDTKINSYFSSTTYYPSNAQIWTSGKDASDDFSPTLLDKQYFGSTPAPKGREILDVFNRDRSTASGVIGVTTETETSRPKTCAFFAGRAWYSGINSTTLSSWVLFSQICEDDAKYGLCYQDADPTAEFISDLIATDGGFIPIPEAGGIKKLFPIQDSIIVFADNGIWQITGDAGGFSATGYQVKKVSSFGCISSLSVVAIDNTGMYWSPAGIFVLKIDNVSGIITTEPVSVGKIQTLYTSISNFGKKYSVGFFNDEEKKVRWLYQDVATETSTDRFKKDKVLTLDLRLGAFYTWSLADGDPFIVSGIITTNQGLQDSTVSVVADADSVLSSTDSVISAVPVASSGPRSEKYLTISPSGTDWTLTFSDFDGIEDAPDKFMDWFSYDGIGLETTILPYLITGYQTLQDGAKNFQAPYIITYMKRTETGFVDIGGGQIDPVNESSCTLQGRWGWTDSVAANRWTTAREIYKHRRLFTPDDASSDYDDGYPLVIAKSKIPGKGQALSLKYSCASGKDMQLVGWAVMYNKNMNV